MNNLIRNEVDDLIRENKVVIYDQYYCESQSLSEKDIKQLTNILWRTDARFKELIKDYIQDLINERIDFVKEEDNYNRRIAV